MLNSVMILIFVAIVGVPMWTHPVRRKLWGLVGLGRSATERRFS
jgi:hypothetical protein